MDQITTNPRLELPYSMHDGWGGKEWFFTFKGIQHGAYETEAEAKSAMERMFRAARAELRAREMNAELPDDLREVMQLKGMI